MIINLSDPFWRTLIAGLILMIIGGAYHYIKTLVALNITNKKLGDILAEFYSLQQKHNEEITNINKENKEKSGKIITDILNQSNKELNKLSQEIENIKSRRVAESVIPAAFRKQK